MRCFTIHYKSVIFPTVTYQHVAFVVHACALWRSLLTNHTILTGLGDTLEMEFQPIQLRAVCGQQMSPSLFRCICLRHHHSSIIPTLKAYTCVRFDTTTTTAGATTRSTYRVVEFPARFTHRKDIWCAHSTWSTLNNHIIIIIIMDDSIVVVASSPHGWFSTWLSLIGKAIPCVLDSAFGCYIEYKLYMTIGCDTDVSFLVVVIVAWTQNGYMLVYGFHKNPFSLYPWHETRHKLFDYDVQSSVKFCPTNIAWTFGIIAWPNQPSIYVHTCGSLSLPVQSGGGYPLFCAST